MKNNLNFHSDITLLAPTAQLYLDIGNTEAQ